MPSRRAALLLAFALTAVGGGGGSGTSLLARCDYAVGGPTVSSRTNTIQHIAFGTLLFEQDCDEAEARGPGLLNLTRTSRTSMPSRADQSVRPGCQRHL